jgi:hypothetical protein
VLFGVVGVWIVEDFTVRVMVGAYVMGVWTGALIRYGTLPRCT